MVLLFSSRLVQAEDCEICKMRLQGDIYLLKDPYHNKTRVACKACTLLTTRCVVCDVQVRPDLGLQLPDGRVYCAEDSKTAVMTEEVAKALFSKAREHALDFLSPYPPLPQFNIETYLVTREEFNRQYRRTPRIDNPEALLGLTISRRTEKGKFAHDIYLLHGVPENEFLAVCAHEYTHTWLNEREKKARQIYKDTEEGFCELIAYKVSSKLGFELEKKRLLENNYTHGQISVLLAAENEYSFHHLVHWINDGVDSWLDSDQLPRVLVLREAQKAPPEEFRWIQEKPTPVPDKLVLKGVSGSSTRQFALINNATLSVNEQTRVRVGASNVLVRCLSISTNAVVIQVQGEHSPRQLQLELK